MVTPCPPPKPPPDPKLCPPGPPLPGSGSRGIGLGREFSVAAWDFAGEAGDVSGVFRRGAFSTKTLSSFGGAGGSGLLGSGAVTTSGRGVMEGLCIPVPPLSSADNPTFTKLSLWPPPSPLPITKGAPLGNNSEEKRRKRKSRRWPTAETVNAPRYPASRTCGLMTPGDIRLTSPNRVWSLN